MSSTENFLGPNRFCFKHDLLYLVENSNERISYSSTLEKFEAFLGIAENQRKQELFYLLKAYEVFKAKESQMKSSLTSKG